MKNHIIPKLFLTLLITTTIDQAGGTPCSGKKGSIDHYEGEKFVCHDGSFSTSKKDCSITFGDGGTTLAKRKANIATPATKTIEGTPIRSIKTEMSLNSIMRALRYGWIVLNGGQSNSGTTRSVTRVTLNVMTNLL